MELMATPGNLKIRGCPSHVTQKRECESKLRENWQSINHSLKSQLLQFGEFIAEA